MASELKTRLQNDLNAARKDRDKLRTLVISTAISEVRNVEINTKEEIDDDGLWVGRVRDAERIGIEFRQQSCNRVGSQEHVDEPRARDVGLGDRFDKILCIELCNDGRNTG